MKICARAGEDRPLRSRFRAVLTSLVRSQKIDRPPETKRRQRRIVLRNLRKLSNNAARHRPCQKINRWTTAEWREIGRLPALLRSVRDVPRLNARKKIGRRTAPERGKVGRLPALLRSVRDVPRLNAGKEINRRTTTKGRQRRIVLRNLCNLRSDNLFEPT